VGPARWAAYKAAGFDADPELLYVASTDFEKVPFQKYSENSWVPEREVGDPSPVAAWAPDYNATAAPGPPRRGVALETAATAVFRAQYEAFAWLLDDVEAFPIIDKGP
jgi:hypothetical protein